VLLCFSCATSFEKATGLVFYGETKKNAGDKLKALKCYHFEQLLLLEIFNLLANSTEVENLNVKPLTHRFKEQQRMQMINHYVEANYQNEIDVNHVAKYAISQLLHFVVLPKQPIIHLPIS
jgi:hypothetical protein